MDESSKPAEPGARWPARPWRPGPLVWTSAALHAAVLALSLGRRGQRALPAALLANHAVLAVAGLWPRSRALGPNLVRLPRSAERRGEVALTFDDGPDPEGTPEVLDLLDRHGARASFFCVGERVDRWPELAAEIVRRGHRVENHTYSHPWFFSLLGPAAIAREVDRGQEAIARATGVLPRWVRAPAGLRSVLLEPVLARRGLWLASWTRRGLDALGADPDRVLRRLVNDLEAGDVLVLHDAAAATGGRLASKRAARRAADRPDERCGGRRPAALEVLPALLDRLARDGLRSVPLPDPAEVADGADSVGGSRV